jgi:hypothetical protein
MFSKLSKTIVFGLAVLLVAAPLVLAQQSGSGSSGMGPSDRPSTGTGMTGSGSTGSTTGTQSPSMGTMGAHDAIHATVTDVNQQQKTVKLRMQSGETVELKVPEQSLVSLSKGDSVQVSIRKAEGQSGMKGQSGKQQSRPESGSGSTESTGTQSR